MQYVVITLTLASVYGLFAIGLSLAWGVGKTLNLAHGAIFMTAGYVVYEISRRVILPLGVLVAIGALCAGVLTLTVEVAVFRAIRKKAANLLQAELGQLLASLGLSAIIVSLVARWTKSALQPIPSEVYQSDVYHLFGARVLSVNVIIVATSAVLILLTVLLVQRTGFGRALRAVAFSPRPSELLGVNPEMITGLTMFISGALAGVAGVLVAVQQLGVEAHAGDLYILKGFAVVILGGAGSIVGTAAGALVVATAETLTVIYIGSGFRDLIAFVVILAVLLLRPGGLFATVRTTRA